MPAPGCAHLWLCDVDGIDDPALLSRYRELLDRIELERMQRFKFDRDRHRFLVSHALLRCVLSCYAETAPEKWCFVVGPHGKPALAPTLQGVNFNLSHSGSYALLALSTGCELTGVDIERHRSTRDFHALARRKFAPLEAKRLRLLSGVQLVAEFHDTWTLKEAFVKATGEGLSRSLAHFHFDIDRSNGLLVFSARPELESDPGLWRFWCYRPDRTCSAALALRVSDHAVGTEAPLWFDMVPLQGWDARDVPWLLRS